MKKKKRDMTKEEKRQRIKQLDGNLESLNKHITEFEDKIRKPLEAHPELPEGTETHITQLRPQFYVNVLTKRGEQWGSGGAMKIYNMDTLNPQIILDAYYKEITKQRDDWERELKSYIN